MRAVLSAFILLLAWGCHHRSDSGCDSVPIESDCDNGSDHDDPGEFDRDGDGAVYGVDCDDADPARAPGLPDAIGDGVDQDCDGSDQPTRSLREAAAGRYSTDLPGAKLGWMVACGPDRGGDGIGDLAAIASEFGMNRLLHTFAAALPGPVPGEHPVDDVLDLRVGPGRLTGFTMLLGLVDQVHGGGLFVQNTDEYEPGLLNRVSFVTESGPLEKETPTFGWKTEDMLMEYAPSPYAGPADLTGDGAFDFALGPVVVETIPQGWVDLEQAGQLALEPNEEPGLWAGIENAVGDLNGDGQDDLLFSHAEPPVWLVFGPIGDTPAVRSGPNVAEFWPEQADLPTARNLDFAVGDVSGDGVDDLVVANMWYGADPSSPQTTGIGAVYVWFGPLAAGRHTTATADVRFVGELPGSWTGQGLALGDFDGDGIQNLVVGASAYWLWVPGLVYVFDDPLPPGELTAGDAVAIYRGEQPAASTGRSIATCDTDRDGRDELVIGAPLVDYSAEMQDSGVFYWLTDVR